MRLGQFIAELRDQQLDKQVRIAPFDLVPVAFSSYRGYYEDLALSYQVDGDMSAAELLALCREALGKTFQGWKGGNYKMYEYTRLWISNRGRVSNRLVKSIQDDFYLYIYTTDGEWGEL